MQLSVRRTQKYVGTYQHLDSWDYIGTVDELCYREMALPEGRDDFAEADDDMCETKRNEVFALVKTEAGVSDEDIQRALRDTYTQHGCACEHDCCGCRSYHASLVERVTGNLWRVEISSSRNF